MKGGMYTSLLEGSLFKDNPGGNHDRPAIDELFQIRPGRFAGQPERAIH
jgi:hypothetical protein